MARIARKKLQLVDGWRNAWSWISVKCMVLAGAIQGAWLFIPDDMKASIPQNVLQVVTFVLLGVGVAGRLTKQDLP